jgi:hypothetical protein
MYTRGMGATDKQIGGAIASTGGALLASARYTGPAAPFVAIAGAALEIGGAITSLFGPNPNNDIASGYVNQIEADIMKPNLAAWESESKTSVNQVAAEQNFTSGWNMVLQLCDNPALGSAGVNCVGDRQRGGKWDWWKMYYDPIANDPNVVSNPLSSVSSLFGGGSSLLPLFLIGGLLLAVSD